MKLTWLYLGVLSGAVACGGATSADPNAGSGGSSASGGSAGVGGGAGTAGASGCTCAIGYACVEGTCVERMRLVSQGTGGVTENAPSVEPSVSEHGQWVAFSSQAKLTPDASGESNVYIRDMQTAVLQIFSGDAGNRNGRNVQANISANGQVLAFATTVAYYSSDTNDGFDVYSTGVGFPEVRWLSQGDAGTRHIESSLLPSIDASGQRVAFESEARLVPEDDNEAADIYLSDGGNLRMASMPNTAPQAFPGSGSHSPAISADGNFLTFISNAPGYAPGDTDLSYDVFLADLRRGNFIAITDPTLASDNFFFAQAPRLSADGSYVVFVSEYGAAQDESPGHPNVYLYERQSGRTRRMSVGQSGVEASNSSQRPDISGDGRYVVFDSAANDLVAGDTEGHRDVFVVDTQTLETARVSVTPSGTGANGHSQHARISLDGNFVVFDSEATDLTDGDANASADVYIAVNPLRW